MLIGAILTFGNWHLVGSLIYWLGLLFCAFAAGCVILTASEPSTKEKSMPKSPPLFPPPTFMPEVQRQGKRTVWISSLTLILGTILGIALGYGRRDHELASNTRMYFGVTVLSQQSDRSYTVKIPGYDKAYPWDFCYPIKMPSQVIDIKYEQKTGCKVIGSTGFLAPHEEKNNGVQTGLNPATAKPATWAGLEGR